MFSNFSLGRYISKGHFFCLAEDANGSVWELNDDFVSPSSFEEINRFKYPCSLYLLCYQKVISPPASPLHQQNIEFNSPHTPVQSPIPLNQTSHHSIYQPPSPLQHTPIQSNTSPNNRPSTSHPDNTIMSSKCYKCGNDLIEITCVTLSGSFQSKFTMEEVGAAISNVSEGPYILFSDEFACTFDLRDNRFETYMPEKIER